MFGFSQPFGRAIRWPLRVVPKHAVLPIVAGPNRGMRWIAGSLVHGCWIGWYEKRCVKFVASQIRPGMTVFDVGANVGYYTLLMSRLVGPTGRVLAFEPLPANVRFLREHLRLNEIKNVEVIEAAVSDKDGVAFLTGDRSMAHLADAGIDVKTVRLDNYPMPTFIKMDIEGAETAALRGATRILDTRKALLFIALHGSANQEVPALLSERGYRLNHITTSEISASPVPDQRPEVGAAVS